MSHQVDKPKILLIHPTIYPQGVARLKEDATIIMAPAGDPETLKEYLRSGVDGIIVRLEQLPANVITAGDRLKVIGVNGSGVNNVDVNFATERGIAVVNVVGANSYSVAEHINMYMLALARDVKRADLAVRSGYWQYRDEHTPHDIHGNIFLSVGYGNIGKDICRVVKSAYDMRVLVYDPFVENKEIMDNGYEKVERLQDGLREADYISLHLPHNKQTHHLINAATIAYMKPGCKFINCARGPIVDYDALCDALASGQIGMAGLDVYPDEPVSKEHRIFTLENVIATPHCAGDTYEARTRIALSVANDVLKVLNGECPSALVNPLVAEANPSLFR